MKTPLINATSGFVVIVAGAGAPSIVHSDFESAFAESDRLTRMMGKTSFVAELRASNQQIVAHVARIFL